MKRKVLLILAFICVQLFAYTSFCAQNFADDLSFNSNVQKTYLQNPLSGFINNTQNDAHFVSLNMSQKFTSNQQKRSQAAPEFVYVPDFNSRQYSALLKYISDKSRLKNKNNYIAFGSQLVVRAP